MYPTEEIAKKELEIAGERNPGLWTLHSKNVAEAAKNIALSCKNINPEKAFVCGLLHDIGRRTGIAHTRHIIDGYNYAMEKGWDEVARVCLTHSYPIQDVEKDVGKKDISKEQYEFIQKYIQSTTYDDYDKLIILCDALGSAKGFCILEKRFVDVTRRYGIYPFTIERWNKVYEIKEYFEKNIGKSVYKVLPNIEKCIFE